MKVIYPTDTGIAVIHPTAEIPAEEVARKDVPAGVPYLIVDAIPDDRTFREAWTASFDEPDGYGVGHGAWEAEQAAIRARQQALDEEVRQAIEDQQNAERAAQSAAEEQDE